MENQKWVSLYRVWANYPDTLVKILQKTSDVSLARIYRTCHFMRHFMEKHAEQIGKNIFAINFFFEMGRVKYTRALTRPPIMSGRETWIPKYGTPQRVGTLGTYRLMFTNLLVVCSTHEEVGGFGPWFILRNMSWRIGINIRSNLFGRRILAVFLQSQIDLPELSIDVDANFSIISQNPGQGDFMGTFAHNYSKDHNTFGFEEFTYLDKIVSSGLAAGDCLLLELKMRAGPVQNVLTPLEYQNRIEEMIQKANSFFVNRKDVNLAIEHIKQAMLYCADRNPGEVTKAHIEWHLQTYRDYQREMLARN